MLQLIEEGETMVPLDFDYDLEEIVQMAGVGSVSLKSALKRMPDRIDAQSVLWRDLGKHKSKPYGRGTGPIRASGRATAKPTRMIFRRAPQR
jgi:hypothetical protein